MCSKCSYPSKFNLPAQLGGPTWSLLEFKIESISHSLCISTPILKLENDNLCDFAIVDTIAKAFVITHKERAYINLSWFLHLTSTSKNLKRQFVWFTIANQMRPTPKPIPWPKSCAKLEALKLGPLTLSRYTYIVSFKKKSSCVPWFSKLAMLRLA